MNGQPNAPASALRARQSLPFPIGAAGVPRIVLHDQNTVPKRYWKDKANERVNEKAPHRASTGRGNGRRLLPLYVQYSAMKPRTNPPGRLSRCRRVGAPIVLFLLAASPVIGAQTSSEPPRPPATKKAPGKESSPPPRCYAVQVGAYENRAEAEAMQDNLTRSFPNGTQLSQVVTGDKTRWRLRLVAASRAEAVKIAARLLRERQIKAWIEPIPCSQ